jgi:hypothetical protein
VARFAGRAILQDPELELVGCYAHTPAKVGTDVGELIGVPPVGITATADIEALINLHPDVVAYYPMLLREDVPRHTETLCRLMRSGINVVTTANLVTGRWWKATEAFEAAGREGGASIFGSGVNPGFANAMALTAASVCTEVRRVSIWEEAECSGYDSAAMWQSLAFGRPPDDPGNAESFRQGTAPFEDTVAMMADALELPLTDIRYLPEVATANIDLDLGFMRIPAGHVAGLKNRWVGLVGDDEVIELGMIWKMTEEVTPNWEIRHGWHIRIDGLPTVETHVAGWPPEGESNSEVLMGLAMLMTAMSTVNAIPHVVRASPGVVTYTQLPRVTAARRVRTPAQAPAG